MKYFSPFVPCLLTTGSLIKIIPGTVIIVRLFIVIVSIITIAEIVCYGMLFTLRQRSDSTLKPYFKTAIENGYTGDSGLDVTTLGLNFLFTEFDCCGADNYKDLHQAKHWNRTVMVYGLAFQMEIPLMCCKLEGTYPSMVIPNDKTCTMIPNDENSYYSIGCYDEIEKSVNKYQHIIIGVGVGVLCIEIISIEASIYLVKELLFLRRKLCNVTPRVWK